jgi:Glycosyl hydrolase family 10
MGIMQFQIPGDLTSERVEGVRRTYLAGGYDHSPVPTRADLTGDRLTLRRDNDESGCVYAPWEIPGVGWLMGSSATLMERAPPYQFLLELARGKVNQVRSQACDWKLAGLEIPAEIEEQIRKATHLFGNAIAAADNGESNRLAEESLALAYVAADSLVALYVEQVMAFRLAQNQRVETLLGVRLNEPPSSSIQDDCRLTFNTIGVPLTWRTTEPVESNYKWECADATIDWALENQLSVTCGPLIDFSWHGIPDWLKPWAGDMPSLSSFMCDYIETAVSRYQGKIRRWLICSGSNCARALRLTEDDLIRLTARLAESAWGIDPQLEVLVGLAQPWGEYLSGDYFNYSPFVFADTLLRAGLPLAGFELEWHMGVQPRGTWCRDPLEASRLLDMFSVLGVPLQIGLSYPSSDAPDALADPEQILGKSGWWHGLTPLAQAEWAEAFTGLAMAKGHVLSVFWDHLSDASPHRFPNAGLVYGNGERKPAFDRLRMLRETYLRPPRIV